MANDIAQYVDSLYSGLKAKRSLWEGTWRDIARYIVPFRENINNTSISDAGLIARVYDGTAIKAAKLFADGLHASLVSSDSQWFNLLMENEELNNNGDVLNWLQTVTLQLYRKFANSTFYSEFWNYLYDGGTIGTAIMYMEFDNSENRYIFETVHPGECYIAEDQFRFVDTVIRIREMTAKQMVERFGYENVPEEVRTLASGSSGQYNSFRVLHAVFKRNDYDPSNKLSVKKRYASIWKLEGSNDILKESGYDYFPYAIWRYTKASREAYGYSPANYALLDIKSNNIVAKSNLMQAQTLANPPYNVPVELRGKVNLRPNGINYYSDPSRLVSPVNIAGNLEAGLTIEEKKRRIIEEHFNLDFFFMLAQSDKPMTATEVLKRQGEKAAVLSSAIGRLNSEALDRIIDFVFATEETNGQLPMIPEILLNFGGENIKIEYVGQMAKAQRRLFVTQAVNASMETITPLLGVFPDAADVIKPKEAAREILRAYGFPEKAIRSRDEIEELEMQRMQQNQIGSAVGEIAGAANVGKDIAKIDKEAGTNLVQQILNSA